MALSPTRSSQNPRLATPWSHAEPESLKAPQAWGFTAMSSAPWQMPPRRARASSARCTTWTPRQRPSDTREPSPSLRNKFSTDPSPHLLSTPMGVGVFPRHPRRYEQTEPRRILIFPPTLTLNPPPPPQTADMKGIASRWELGACVASVPETRAFPSRHVRKDFGPPCVKAVVDAVPRHQPLRARSSTCPGRSISGIFCETPGPREYGGYDELSYPTALRAPVRWSRPMSFWA